MKPGDLVLIGDNEGAREFWSGWQHMQPFLAGLGSRYLYEASGEEHEKEMKCLNRHFDESGNIARYYDPNIMKTLPGFDDW